MTSTPISTKACHTCRRKRLRCDRTYPHCNKCTTAGRECLGYGNLLRWTGAIASRGKLAGKVAPLPTSTGQRTSEIGPSTTVGSSQNDVQELLPSSEGEEEMQLVKRLIEPVESVASPWALVDPLFQDLSPSSRYYLSYFTNRLCKDLVSYDLPERNPFRSLLPMTQANPLLQHIIVAASAVHLSNLISPAFPPSATQEKVICPINVEASQAALTHGLVAKQKALRLMHDALENIKSMPGDVILAAALFFVNVELIESGKHGWKAHLDGAGQIMTVLQLTKLPSSDLLDYMLSDCFVYFILGSAFTPRVSEQAATHTYFQSSNIPLVLQKAAANSYQCCPPEILEILHGASKLSNLSQDDEGSIERITADAAALLNKALQFDIVTWAYDVRNTPSFSNVPVQSRIHTGTAHRLAACLYILQAVPSLARIVGATYADVLSEELYGQLASVPDDDQNFKATSWPTFIAGAREVNPERRGWIMDRLQRLGVQVPWGFIYTAMETLHMLWKLNGTEDGSRSWVQILKDPELNFLMV